MLTISFMIGLVKEMIYIIICFIIHEIGHYFFIRIFKYKATNITVYPFGGIISYQEKNDFIHKSFFIMIGGVLFNLIFYLVFSILNIKILAQINLCFFIINILPINPLDGGRLLILSLSLFLPTLLSKFVVYIFSIILTISLFLILKPDGLYFYFISLIIIKENVYAIININREYKKFLLLKHLNPNDKLKNKETRFWTNKPIDSLFIGKNMIFDYETFKITEGEVLKKHFKTKKD